MMKYLGSVTQRPVVTPGGRPTARAHAALALVSRSFFENRYFSAFRVAAAISFARRHGPALHSPSRRPASCVEHHGCRSRRPSPRSAARPRHLVGRRLKTRRAMSIWLGCSDQAPDQPIRTVAERSSQATGPDVAEGP